MEVDKSLFAVIVESNIALDCKSLDVLCPGEEGSVLVSI